MWHRTPRGSWSKSEINRMSDSNDEYREVVEGVSPQIGDSVVAYTYPLTEGLVISKKTTEDGRVELTLLIAPHKKKGKAWSRAKVSIRDAARLSKKPPAKFTFPIKCVENLRVEAKVAKADPIWITQVKAVLDKEFDQGEFSSGESDPEQKGEEEGEIYECPQLGNVRHKSRDEAEPERKRDVMEKRIEDIRKLREDKDIYKTTSKKKKKEKETDSSDFEDLKKWWRSRRKRKHHKNRNRKSASSSSSASTSSSSSSSSSEDLPKKGEVREKGSSGLYSCPFNRFDTRGFNEVRCQVQGQTNTRRHVRMALHNLYASCQTLSTFADKMVAKANASSNKPYTMDVCWFQFLAENLDTILLNSLEGPWSLWNEPVVDQMLTGFLELMIRISPNKDYPACFTDSVRKWMKKKRIGTDSKFGPVSYSMQHAKFTEGGVVVQQNNPMRNRERGLTLAKQNNNNNSKTSTFSSSGGEKRAPPQS